MPPRNIQVRQLPEPTDAQIESITRVLMDAFYDDSTLQAVLSGQHKNEPVYHTFFRMQVLGLAHSGDIWIAEDETQEDAARKIVGVAGWFGPGRMFMDSQEQREAAEAIKLREVLPKDYAEWFLSFVRSPLVDFHLIPLPTPNLQYLPRVATFPDRWIGKTTEKDNWFLLALAVLPAYQGKGIGQALFRARAALALSDDRRVFWHAVLPETVAMYESWGAVIRGSEVFECMGRKAVVPKWLLELKSPTSGPP
ncbi:hypothetical protein CALVIDRAFT_542632 [Calocera viscosa TUFC12733]|uniref:N-acetyltransferase domain-containing protein n=1 Tax=Calocera viscosa (strain TUFC12733) TaxID=1330018 RepID=A0A167GFY4_CALVF|nr:hypothetical protein CALVIDRAFT_542632 [Calocera viscosa TUFC12733]